MGICIYDEDGNCTSNSDYIGRLEKENKQLKEVLRKCDPDYTDEYGYIRCQFCNGINHYDGCEYVRLTKESEGEV